MFKFLVYTLLFFIASTLQTVVVPQISIFDAQPSLLLILTVMVALRYGPLAGCFMGFVSGLLYDVYAPVEWLGAYSFSYCIIGFVVGQIEESFINLTLFLKIILLAAVELVKDCIYFLAIGKKGDEILQAFISFSLPNALYTICLGAIFFYLLTFSVYNRKISQSTTFLRS